MICVEELLELLIARHRIRDSLYFLEFSSKIDETQRTNLKEKYEVIIRQKDAAKV